MRVVNVDEFIKINKTAIEQAVKNVKKTGECDNSKVDAYKDGVLSILDNLDTYEGIMKASDIPEIIHPKGCDSDSSLSCKSCEHHRLIEWCARAIPNHEVNIDYETGWNDGFSAAEEYSNGYNWGYEGGYKEGYN